MRRRFAVRDLAVPVVAAALIGCALASLGTVRKWFQDWRIESAISVVSAELRAARNQAILHRRFVAVLMPSAQDSNHGGVHDERYKARAIRSCILADPPEYEFANKKYQARFASYSSPAGWSLLPERFYIGYTESFGQYDPDGSKTLCNVVDNVPFPLATSAQTLDNVRALIFTPTGGVIATPHATARGLEYTEILVHSGILKNTNELWRLDENLRMATIRVNHLSGKLNYD